MPVEANCAIAPFGVAFDACPPVLEYTSVSKTKILTFSPDAITWSSPPNPMSYAQPSPPNNHTDFLEISFLFFNKNLDISFCSPFF